MRKITNYNPKKFRDRDLSDIEEAGFGDIDFVKYINDRKSNTLKELENKKINKNG